MANTEEKAVPRHAGIIMSGSRRWAAERNLPAEEGYKRSFSKLKQAPEWFFSQKIKALSIFVFSSGIWETKDQGEINFLMKLISNFFKEDLSDWKKRGYRLVLSGKIGELPGDLPEICREASAAAKDNEGGMVNMCLNYDGREEIIEAVGKIIANKIKLEQVHEGMIKKYLYNSGLGDPELIIGTAGDQSLKGFLLWGSHASELFFLRNYWPDLEKSDIAKSLEAYNKSRNFSLL